MAIGFEMFTFTWRRSIMADPAYDNGTPWWGWVLIVAALAMFVGLIVKSLGSVR